MSRQQKQSSMDTKTAVPDIMAKLKPTAGDPLLPEPTPCNDKPSEPQPASARWSSVESCLCEDNSHDFRKRFIGLDEAHPKSRTLARWVERWIKAAATNQRTTTRWVALCGGPGTGKSHSLKAAYAFLRAHGVSLWPKWHKDRPPQVVFRTWSKVVGASTGHWLDFEEEVQSARFVLLDDVGSETDRYRTGEPAERLRLILEMCAAKWVLISTNLTRETFGHAFDPRVQSRMEAAACLDMTGAPDGRTRKE